MTISAVLPIKNLLSAKQRLAGVLTPAERQQLCEAMVRDVLCVLAKLQQEGLLAQLWVLSDDARLDDIVAGFGIERLSEEKLAERFPQLCPYTGLNRAAELAAAFVRATFGEQHGLLIVHGDLPLANIAELRRLLLAHKHNSRSGRSLSIIADRHGKGSNVLASTPAGCVPFSYGQDSYALHIDSASSQGITTQIIASDDYALDVDTEKDMQQLLTRLEDAPASQASNTRCYLEHSGVGQRLQAMYFCTATASREVSL